MKFGRLLATGKSLVNGNVAGRYQMRQGLNLPQFISPKNPFKQEAVAKPVAFAPAAAAPANVSAITPVMAPVSVAPGSLPLPVVEKSMPTKTRPPLPVKLRAAALWSGEALRRAAVFCLDHNPFSAIGKPKLAGIPRFGKPAEQPELSLDRVRVVRNDLAHADLEVVRAGGGAK